MQATLQDVLQAGFGSFSAGRRLRAAVHRMARSVMACRTSRLGGHVKLCPVGHIEGVWYNSCKHRACPQCAGIQIERWIERQRARLLGCDHFHVVCVFR